MKAVHNQLKGLKLVCLNCCIFLPAFGPARHTILHPKGKKMDAKLNNTTLNLDLDLIIYFCDKH